MSTLMTFAREAVKHFFRLALVLTLFTGLFPSPAHSDTIVFTDREAFTLAAQPGPPLTVNQLQIVANNIFLFTYGDILRVDFSIPVGLTAVLSSCGTDAFAGFTPVSTDPPITRGTSTCTAIPYGGQSPPFPFPGENAPAFGAFFLEPVTGVGYDVSGTFSLFGETVQTSTPLFFGFVFDEPPLSLPSPRPVVETVTVGPPGFEQTVEFPSFFVVENVQVSTVPEPTTLLLFGVAASALLGRKRRS